MNGTYRIARALNIWKQKVRYMARSLWEVFLSLFGREEENTDEEVDDRFVPSPLDLSVRFSHGGHDNEVERELNKIDEQAQELEEKQQ